MKSIIKNFLNKIIGFLNFKLISKKEIFDYKNYLFCAIKALTETEKKNYSINGLSCIVFSKDRAIQLYALLESYNKFVQNPVDIIVIYKSSSDVHEKSYIELKNIIKNFPFNINFIKEKKNFRETLLDTLSKIKTKNIFFLTDDDIFINEFDFNLLLNINFYEKTFSLRHNPKISYSFTANANFKPPKFSVYKLVVNFNEFNWFDSGYEWSDPWSVNGHIYLTAEIMVISRISNYKFPNSYESALKFFNFLMIDRKGLCCNESIIMNIPMNIVQTEYKNLHGNISSDFLLHNWKNGNKINIDHLEKFKSNSTHININKEIEFKKR
jgi:hypothetical protein